MYLDPKQLFKVPIEAPNSQEILQFSINLLIKKITNDISNPPKIYIKQNIEKDFINGCLKLLLKTHDFAKTKEISIPIKQPVMEANNIFLKIEYKVL